MACGSERDVPSRSPYLVPCSLQSASSRRRFQTEAHYGTLDGNHIRAELRSKILSGRDGSPPPRAWRRQTARKSAGAAGEGNVQRWWRQLAASVADGGAGTGGGAEGRGGGRKDRGGGTDTGRSMHTDGGMEDRGTHTGTGGGTDTGGDTDTGGGTGTGGGTDTGGGMNSGGGTGTGGGMNSSGGTGTGGGTDTGGGRLAVGQRGYVPAGYHPCGAGPALMGSYLGVVPGGGGTWVGAPAPPLTPRSRRKQRRKKVDGRYACARAGCAESYLNLEHVEDHEFHHDVPGGLYLACSVGGCTRRFKWRHYLRRHEKVDHGAASPTTSRGVTSCGVTSSAPGAVCDTLTVARTDEGQR